MHIQEVMKNTGLSKKALQYYEDKKLITVHKDGSGYRDYDDQCIYRLRQIKILRRLDFSVAEIEIILKGKEREAIFNEHFNEIDMRMARCAIQKNFIAQLYHELESTQNPEILLQMEKEIEQDFILNESIHIGIQKKKLLDGLKTVLAMITVFCPLIGIIMMCTGQDRYILLGFVIFLCSAGYMNYLLHKLEEPKSYVRMMVDDGIYKLKNRVEKGFDKSCKR